MRTLVLPGRRLAAGRPSAPRGPRRSGTRSRSSSSTRIAPSCTVCTCSAVSGSVGASLLTGSSHGSCRTAGPVPRRLAPRPPNRRVRRRVAEPCSVVTGLDAPRAEVSRHDSKRTRRMAPAEWHTGDHRSVFRAAVTCSEMSARPSREQGVDVRSGPDHRRQQGRPRRSPNVDRNEAGEWSIASPPHRAPRPYRAPCPRRLQAPAPACRHAGRDSRRCPPGSRIRWRRGSRSRPAIRVSRASSDRPSTA